ncbi:MAG: trypsin-like peptidase domain-containing protein [Parcubacteria group bacterium]|nr:trypsin-like peptidase domain-containing protein [Parcubacteria group bacterium]
MRRFFLLAVAVMVSFAAAGCSTVPIAKDGAIVGINAMADTQLFVRMAEKALPVVVSVQVRYGGQPQEETIEVPTDPGGKDIPSTPPFGGPGQSPFNVPEDPLQPPRGGVGGGSGFIISADGYVVTNNHVVNDASEIKVFVGEKSYEAKVIGTDPPTDIAVIKIEGTSFPTVPMGDSGALKVGEWVMAVGSPFGLNHSVTVGIVSAKGRRGVTGEAYDDFIQTDASINPGNSGGPLINTKGEVIGMNTAIIGGGERGGNVGIGFSVPINMIKEALPQLKETGSITRGWLGIMFQPVTPELMKLFKLETNSGAVVKEAIKDGPAEKAGIKREDVVLSFNGVPIASSEDFPKLVASVRPGTSVPVEIWRNGKKETMSVTIEKRDPSISSRTPNPRRR